MKSYLVIFIVIGCLLPVSAIAIKVPGLYEVEVPVTDHMDTSRNAAIKTALGMVLVKLTGDRYALARKSLQPVLRQSERYVQQFLYEENQGRDTDPRPAAEPRLKLRVRFNEAALEQALRDLGLPVWGKERPSTLLWLAVEDDYSRRLISLESGSDYISIIDKRAGLRGIALLYPLLDLEDTMKIRASDVWGGFMQTILNASRRYQADSILIGSITSPVSGIWEGRWTAYINGQTSSWRTEGELPDIVLDEGVDGMADILAAQFAQSSVFATVDSVKISVVDIYNVDQYAKVLEYLGSLNSVTDVQVTTVKEGSVAFTVTAHGGELAIAQAIALGQVLQPISGVQGNTYRLLYYQAVQSE